MSGSLSPWPVVQIGHHGHPVETLQFLLRARGHQLAVDGVFGPLTAAAAKAAAAGFLLPADEKALIAAAQESDVLK